MRLLVPVFLVPAGAMVLGAAGAADAPRTFDVLTYVPPAGWSVQASPAVVTLVHTVSAADSCAIALYASSPKSGDLAASFQAEWTRTIVPAIHPADTPASSPMTLPGGIAARMAIAAGTAQGKPVIATLTVLDAGERVAPIVVLTPNLDAAKACQASFGAFLAGIRLTNVASAATPALTAAVAPVSGIPRLGAVPAAPDLTGHWRESNPTAFQSDYYAPSGALTATTTSVAINGLEFTAGRFHYRSTGLANGVSFDDSDSGTFELGGGVLVCKGSVRTMKLRVVGWEERKDATVMLTVPEGFGPTPRDSDVKYYGEYWIRAKSK